MAPQDSKIAVEILQSVNNRTQSLLKLLRMVITDIVINTRLGRVTRQEILPVCIVQHGTMLLFLVLLLFYLYFRF